MKIVLTGYPGRRFNSASISGSRPRIAALIAARREPLTTRSTWEITRRAWVSRRDEDELCMVFGKGGRVVRTMRKKG